MAKRLCAALSAAVLLTSMVLPASAIAKDPPRRLPQRVDLSKVHLNPNFTPAVLRQNQPVDVIVEMADAPVALRQRDAHDAGKTLTDAQRIAIRDQVRVGQKPVRDGVKALGGKVLADYQDAYNGMRIQATPAQIAKIAAMPGVVGVHQVTRFAPPVPNAAPGAPDNVHSVPYIGAPRVWSDTGFTGVGIKIGIIDTGIDYYHANLGGSGNPADFANANRTSLADGGFPNAKVAGGYDFAGDDYNADRDSPDYQPVPHPDPDPLDCASTSSNVGHGSHVAGTAAGNGVLSNGAAYSGPYTNAALSNNSWRIGPGVAPKAKIYGYRVFGCAGSSDLVLDAINRAVADGVDVINMSLGSPFGHGDEPDSVAANNAALAGVIVVASAGNQGASDLLGNGQAFITGSPAVADRVIAVAAMEATAGFPGGSVSLASGPVDVINANAAPLPVTGRIRPLMADATSISLGCDQADYAGVQPGDIVVVERGTCDRVDRAHFGQAAGAGAVVMVNNQPGFPPFEGDIPGVTIPFLGAEFGDQPWIDAAGQNVTVTAKTLANPLFRERAAFTSPGPRNGDNFPKPDISAPGVSVFSTSSGTGNGAQSLSGTSMASPAVAGVAALVRQAHPSWTVEKIKAAMMNTADATGSGRVKHWNQRFDGTGVVAARRAVDTVGLVTTKNGRGSLGFGYEPHDTAFAETLPFTLWNTSGSAITYDVATVFDSGGAGGAVVTPSPAVITVAAHDKATVNVKLSMTKSALSALGSVDPYGVLKKTSGVVVATPRTTGAGRYPLRVPFLVSPRPLSNVTAGKSSKYTPAGGGIFNATIPVTNPGIVETYVDVYAWGLSDANEGLATNDIRAVGVQTWNDGNDDQIWFAVNTYGRWSSAVDSEVDISIDVDNDHVTDFIAAAVDAGVIFLDGDLTGDLLTAVVDAHTNTIIDVWIDSAPSNGSTMLIPVTAADLGLTPGSSAFDYTVESFTFTSTGPSDPVPGTGHFDVYAPAVSQGDYLPIAAKGSLSLAVSVNRPNLGHNPALGWMLVALDDANGQAQADLVPVDPSP